MTGFGRLSADQRARVDAWMPDAQVIADHSWGLVETTVLEVESGGRRLIVKAGGAGDHHLTRELDAHDGWTDVWTRTGRAARLVHGDRDRKLAVMEFLSGDLAYRTSVGVDPAIHRQAGVLLAAFHAQARRPADGLEERLTARAVAWLDGAHRVDAEAERAAREALARLEPGHPPLVPTHGDWHPRNWIVDGGILRVIDFGRFAFRPAATDFARLAAQEWREAPECEAAFFEGYGEDPRTPEHWALVRLREAIGTACWAYQVGDEPFEAQGHRMLAEVLADLG